MRETDICRRDDWTILGKYQQENSLLPHQYVETPHGASLRITLLEVKVSGRVEIHGQAGGFYRPARGSLRKYRGK
jgi:hypothetical protein